MFQPKIVNGNDANTKEFPFMAGWVQHYDSPYPTIVAGATIISKRYVLTAAHVLHKRNYSEFALIVGSVALSSLLRF